MQSLFDRFKTVFFARSEYRNRLWVLMLAFSMVMTVLLGSSTADILYYTGEAILSVFHNGRILRYNQVSQYLIKPFGDGRFCVQLCIETLLKRATSVAYFDQLFLWIFLGSFHTRCPEWSHVCSPYWCTISRCEKQVWTQCLSTLPLSKEGIFGVEL